jgi:predicted secreted protein
MASEQRTFVFAVSFIILFATLLSTIPAGLQGQGGTGDSITPINPNLLTDFAHTEEYDKTDFTGVGVQYTYVYDLPVGGTTWECVLIDNSFFLGAHTLFVGLWLGGYSWANFISENGTNYGLSVSFTDIDNDLEEGAVRYTLQYEDTGNSAGGFVFWYNTTTYTDSSDAWDSSELFLLHGIGMTADTNIASLLISLLLLQLPDVPLLVNVLLVTPIWAAIIFVLWFIIKEMIPFL